MRSFLALVVVAVLAACGSSNRLPDGTILGTANAVQPSNITIDGKPMRLAPGARIMTPSNTSITPSHVPANSRIRYKLDANGQVSQVWLLPPEK
ncbi:MAG: hypothetical protein ACM3O5_11430 [Betaproteobacteria bacterium]